MKKIVDIAHDFLNLEKELKTGIDFTCGHGFDTLYLAKICDDVYAFDIQEDAVDDTKNKCENYSNVHVVLSDHYLFDHYVQQFDIGIFNLGYLPQGDHKITTNTENVINTLDKALKLLNNNGRIVIVLYPGYEHGYKEARSVKNYCEQLISRHYDVAKFKLINRNLSPYIIVIDKH